MMEVVRSLVGIMMFCMLMKIGATMEDHEEEDMNEVTDQDRLEQLKNRIYSSLFSEESNDVENEERSIKRPGLKDLQSGEKPVQKSGLLSENEVVIFAEQGSKSDPQKVKFSVASSFQIVGRKLISARMLLQGSHWLRSSQLVMKVKNDTGTVKEQKVPIDRATMSATKMGRLWVSISLKDQLKDFIITDIIQPYTQYSLEVTVEMLPPSETDKEDKIQGRIPVLVLKVAAKAKKRVNRAIDCTHGRPRSCCRGRLTVDFEEIGADNVIIAPQKIDIFQCLGHCRTFSSGSGVRYSILSALLLQYRKEKQSTAAINFCCQANKYSDTSALILLRDDTIILREMKNLIVEQCKCL